MVEADVSVCNYYGRTVGSCCGIAKEFSEGGNTTITNDKPDFWVCDRVGRKGLVDKEHYTVEERIVQVIFQGKIEFLPARWTRIVVKRGY